MPGNPSSFWDNSESSSLCAPWTFSVSQFAAREKMQPHPHKVTVWLPQVSLTSSLGVPIYRAQIWCRDENAGSILKRLSVIPVWTPWTEGSLHPRSSG